MLSEYQRTEYTFNPRSKEVENSVPIPIDLGLDDIAEDYLLDFGTTELIQPSAIRSKPTVPDPYANKQMT